MWKVACLWLRSPRVFSLPLSKTTSGTSRPAAPSLERGCARVLSGWCHGCVWDDDLWLWSRVRPCSLFSLPPDMSSKWGWGWGRLMDGPVLFPVMLTWTDCCQDVIFFCGNLFYKRRLNSEKNLTFSQGHWTTKETYYFYLNWYFCTVFLSAKHRGQQSVWLRTLHGLILQLCVSQALCGLAVLPDWLWRFLLPTYVYSPVFSFNVVPAEECSSNDGWWWLKHSERRVKSQYALFLSVPMNNHWNKVFLSVSGDLYECHEWVFLWDDFSSVWFYFSRDKIELFCVWSFSYSFFSPLGGRVCHMRSWSLMSSQTGVEKIEPESKTVGGFRERRRDQIQNVSSTHSKWLREEENTNSKN